MKKTFTVFVLMASLSMFSILFAGEIYVSPRGNDKNAGTKEAPYLTLNHALKQAREWRRLNAPEVAGGISIRLEDGINVIYGENESGKSTIHAFIKGMLFGIERGRGRASLHDTYSIYEPWEGPASTKGSCDLRVEERFSGSTEILTGSRKKRS